MAIEIERKFLVNGKKWKDLGTSKFYRQGYLSTSKESTVRVRLAGDKGYVTIKGPRKGVSRAEYEYGIPYKEAEEMLDKLCIQPIIEKQRHKIPYAGFVWEVDEFFGPNKGLVVAEIELQSEGQFFAKPDWIGEEVTYDRRYSNSNLVRKPFREWDK